MNKHAKLLVKVCVLTKNEEKDLPLCLQSLSKQFKDIIVLDSGSNDRTLEIAKNFGCEILVNTLPGKFALGKQRAWVLSNQKKFCEYILFIDADETISSNFEFIITNAITQDNFSIECYELPLLYKYHDKFIKSLGNPNWHDRLVKTTANFNDNVYEYVKTHKRKKIKNLIVHHHWNSKGLNKFINKHLFYAEYLASESLYEYKNKKHFKIKQITYILKNITKNLGFLRPPLRFIYHYIFKFGFTEGKEGFIVAIHMAIFEFFIQLYKIENTRKIDNKRL